MNRRLTALVLTSVAVFALTGCTGGSDSSTAQESQTLDEACAAVTETIQTALTDFEGVSAEDPVAAANAFQSAATAVGEARAQVGNAEVAAVLPDIEAVFAAAAAAMAASAAGDETMTAELQNIGTDLETSLAKFQELCLE